MRPSRLGGFLCIFSTFSGVAYPQQSIDTLQVSPLAVIFFGPTQAERDSLSRQLDSGIEEVVSDFLFYVGKIRPFLDSCAISVHETSARSFVLLQQDNAPAIFHRRSIGGDLGLILARHHRNPKVLLGVLTDYDLRLMIIEYFGLGNTSRINRIR